MTSASRSTSCIGSVNIVVDVGVKIHSEARVSVGVNLSDRDSFRAIHTYIHRHTVMHVLTSYIHAHTHTTDTHTHLPQAP